jgi:hypothetical protein
MKNKLKMIKITIKMSKITFINIYMHLEKYLLNKKKKNKNVKI